MIVYHSSFDNLRIEWNESATWNVFYGRKNVDCFTQYGVTNRIHAGRVAREWVMANKWGN